VLKSDIEPFQKSIKIAKFLKGQNSTELLNIFHKIPLQKDIKKIVKKLKERSIITAIVTDSYQFIADDLKERLHFDYAFANTLIIKNRIVTGNIILNNKKKEICHQNKIYSICKGMILTRLCDKLNIKNTEVIAVGDGVVDIGMIKKAGLGIAYKAPEHVQRYADVISDDLNIIFEYI
jgi:phosphoserine phosphatase